MSQAGVPDYSKLTVADYRAGLAQMTLPPSTEAVESITDLCIPGPGGLLPIRIYRPSREPNLAVTVFLHGGGFVSLGLDSHDNLCRRIANLSGSVVVSVDYRLAPEAPFPAALDDVCTAVRWAQQQADTLAIDRQRIAIAGDSAGGNLAAAAAALLMQQGVKLRYQLLLYPALDPACASESHRELGEAGYVLTTEMMRWFWSHYLPMQCDIHDPRAAPLQADELRGLPPATIITAECDPLRDEGEAYARALLAAGVPVHVQRVPGMFHGFASMLGFLKQADEAVAVGANKLRESLKESY